MKLDAKLITIILVLQIITGVIVFSLTRAYYLKTPTVAGENTDPSATGQTEPSIQELINGLQNHPQFSSLNDPIDTDHQANQAFQNSDYARAAELYQRVIELAPHKIEPYNNLGLTLHYLGRTSEALEILKSASELQPQYQRVWLTLGFVQSGAGNLQEAREALQRAIELGPETVPGKSATEMLSKLP